MSDFAKARVDSAVESVLGQRDDPKAWAKRLRGMYLRRQTLLPCQIRLASEALGEVWDGGQCRAVEREGEAA